VTSKFISETPLELVSRVSVTLACFCAFLFADARQVIAQPTCPTTVVFGNGIRTDPDEADVSTRELSFEVRQYLNSHGKSLPRECFATAAATNQGWTDLLESATQDDYLIIRDWTRGVFGTGPAAARVEALFVDRMSRFRPDPAVTENDVQSQLRLYEEAINARHSKVALVAHSQGNLFADEAYARLVRSGVSQDSFNVVSVATPAPSTVKNHPHITLGGDIILWVASLPANTSIDGTPCTPNFNDSELRPFFGLNGVVCHGFRTSYLLGTVSQDEILSRVATLVPGPNTTPVAGFVMTELGQSPVSSSPPAPTVQTLTVAATQSCGGCAVVDFNGASPYSTDPDLDGSVVGWRWLIDGNSASSSSRFTQALSIGSHTISLMVTDNQGATSGVAQAIVTVAPAVLRPTAVNDAYSVTQAGRLVVPAPGVLVNDSYPLGAYAEFLGSLPASLLNANPDGSFTLDLSVDATFVGRLALSYVIHSTAGDSNVATVSVLVARSGVPTFTITDLGTLGGTTSAGFSINEQGQVAGYATVAVTDSPRVVRWSGTQVTDLGPGQGWGINESGQVTGDTFVGGFTRAHVWSGSVADPLETPSGSTSVARAINDGGQVAGSVGYPSIGVARPAFWNGGALTEIATPSGTGNGEALDINSLGHVVGDFYYSGGLAGFFWDGTLKTIPGATMAWAVNDLGQVTGRYFDTATNTTSAYIWRDGSPLVVIPIPSGAVGSEGRGINNSGYVVGQASVNPFQGINHAFLYDGSASWDLNNVDVDLSGWTALNSAEAINDRGQITGYGTIDGQQHAFLLTPVTGANRSPWAGFVVTSAAQSSAISSPPATTAVTLNLHVGLGCSSCAIVTFNGAAPASGDPDGAVVAWQWLIDGSVASTSSTFSQALPVGTHTVSLMVTDNQGETSGVAQAIVVVSAPPSPPPGFLAVDDVYSVTQGGVLTVPAVGVLTNDTYPLGSLVEWSFPPVLTNALSIGSSGDFVLDLTQDVAFTGVVAFDYVLRSPSGESSTATVSIQVNPVRAPRFTIQDLGALGGFSSQGVAINEAGEVAGTWVTSDRAARRAFVWDGTTSRDIGDLGGGQTIATGINEFGNISGYSALANGRFRFAFWNGAGLLDPTGVNLNAIEIFGGINDLDQFAGTCPTPDPFNNHACYWDGAILRDIGTLEGQSSFGAAINNNGQMTGRAYVFTPGTSSFQNHAFVWNGSTMQDLGTLGRLSSYGTAINDSGQIAGYVSGSLTPGQGSAQAFLWTGLTMRNIAGPLGCFSYANGINNRAQVVGTASVGCSTVAAYHAFLWDGSTIFDLNDQLVDMAGWTELTSAQAINDRGQITGYGTIDGQQHAFLLTPAFDVRNLSLNISSTGIVPAFRVPCTGRDLTLHYIGSESGAFRPSYSVGVVERVLCQGGLAQFSSLDLAARVVDSGSGGLFSNYRNDFALVVKDTSSNAHASGIDCNTLSCPLINLAGAWNSYDAIVYDWSDSTFPTVAAGPVFRLEGPVWSNVANGDGSVNR
jgi:probable HAF family extracellular repeat protein